MWEHGGGLVVVLACTAYALEEASSVCLKKPRAEQATLIVSRNLYALAHHGHVLPGEAPLADEDAIAGARCLQSIRHGPEGIRQNHIPPVLGRAVALCPQPRVVLVSAGRFYPCPPAAAPELLVGAARGNAGREQVKLWRHQPRALRQRTHRLCCSVSCEKNDHNRRQRPLPMAPPIPRHSGSLVPCCDGFEKACVLWGWCAGLDFRISRVWFVTFLAEVFLRLSSKRHQCIFLKRSDLGL